MKRTFLLLLCSLPLLFSCKKDRELNEIRLIEGKLDPELRYNEVQCLGSHNSYHDYPNADLLAFLEDYSSILPENPEELDYGHEPLLDQLESYGIRQFELDAYHDPEGGLYSNFNGKFLVDKPIESGVDVLDEPGYKVLHIVDIDYRTHEYTLKGALEKFRDWSSANPNHFPVFILLELKSTDFIEYAPLIEALFPGVVLTDAPEIDQQAVDDLENEINEVFSSAPNMLFRPDDIRRDNMTIAESIENHGWPTLMELKGKIMLMLINGGETREFYTSGGNLEGKNCFVSGSLGEDVTSVVMVENPITNALTITEAIEAGYLVRTRSDSGTLEARAGSTERRDAALSSGAQFISTDYYRTEPRHFSQPEVWSDYSVRISSGLNARPNPVVD